jgi:2'-5' RNA ligase
MRATFALLADTAVHNLVRKLAWEIHQKYRTGTIVCRLPPHVSLKQPFAISDLGALEAYMDTLAKGITPFEITLTGIQAVSTLLDGQEVGVLWLNVRETETLRWLHDRLNRELSQRFGDTQAAHDGPEYHFHLTIQMGGQPAGVYRRMVGELVDKNLEVSFIARELAMFVYDEPVGPQGDFLTYKIWPWVNNPYAYLSPSPVVWLRL